MNCQNNLQIYFTSALRIYGNYYFDNVMTKFMINNRTDAWKTDINLLNACHASNPSSNPIALRQVCYKPKILISYLHISIFNAIVYHLNKMSSTISTNLKTRYWNKTVIVRFKLQYLFVHIKRRCRHGQWSSLQFKEIVPWKQDFKNTSAIFLTQSQHGSDPTFAAIDWKIGLMWALINAKRKWHVGVNRHLSQCIPCILSLASF